MNLSPILNPIPSPTASVLWAAVLPDGQRLDRAILLGLSVLGALAIVYVVFFWKNLDLRRRTREFRLPRPTPDGVPDGVPADLLPLEDFPPFAGPLGRRQRIFAEIGFLPGPSEVLQHAGKLPADDASVSDWSRDCPHDWEVRMRYCGYEFLIQQAYEVCDPFTCCVVNDASCPADTLLEFAAHFQRLAISHAPAPDPSVWLTREFPQPVKPGRLVPRRRVAEHVAGLAGATVVAEPDSPRRRDRSFVMVRFRDSYFAVGPRGVYHNAPEGVFLEFAGHLQKIEDPSADGSQHAQRYHRARRPRIVARCFWVAVILVLLMVLSVILC